MTNLTGVSKVTARMELREYPSLIEPPAVADASDLKKKSSLRVFTLKKRQRFRVVVDRKNEGFDENLAALLFAHSCGVPLMILLSDKDKQMQNDISTKLQGIFHCPTCLSFWENEGDLRTTCKEVSYLVPGPSVVLEAQYAAMLVDVLHWSKKFVSTRVENAFSMLRRATNNTEATRALVRMTKDQPTTKAEAEHKDHKNKKEKSKQYKQLAARTAQSFRKALFSITAVSKVYQRSTQANKVIKEIMSKVNLVGMRSDDGCFYPGFFSRMTFSTAQFDLAVHSTERFPKIVFSQEYDKEYISGLRLNMEAVTDFTFACQGKIDSAGCFHSLTSLKDDDFWYENIVFPSVRRVLSAQNRHGQCRHSAVSRFVEIEGKVCVPVHKSVNKSTQFVFSSQGGLELNLCGIFSSGIWYFGRENEYFFSGVFDGVGRFKAAYCIAKTGYLVPGTTNKKRKFIPLSKCVEDGSMLHSYHEEDLSKDQRHVLEELLKLPSIPKADEIRNSEVVDWVCVRNGAIISEPAFITVCSDSALLGDNQPCVYAGGKLGPDGQLYLYGNYNDKGYFFPGGPPVIPETNLKLLSKQPSAEIHASDQFFQNFGIRLVDMKDPKPLKPKTPVSSKGYFDDLKSKTDNQPEAKHHKKTHASNKNKDSSSGFPEKSDSKRRPSQIYNAKRDEQTKTEAFHESNNSVLSEEQLRKELSKENNKKLKLPPTIARKREIERKAKKEKPEDQAKYENGGRLRFTTGDRLASTQQKVQRQAFPLLDPSTVLTTLHTDENLLRDIGYTLKKNRAEYLKPKVSAVPIIRRSENLPSNFVKLKFAEKLKKLSTAAGNSDQSTEVRLSFHLNSADPQEPPAIPPMLLPLKPRDSLRPTPMTIRSKKMAARSNLSDKKSKVHELKWKKTNSKVESPAYIAARKLSLELHASDSINSSESCNEPTIAKQEDRTPFKEHLLPHLNMLSNLSFTKDCIFSYFNLPAYVKDYNNATDEREVPLSQTGNISNSSLQECWHTRQPTADRMQKPK